MMKRNEISGKETAPTCTGDRLNPHVPTVCEELVGSGVFRCPECGRTVYNRKD